MTLTPFPPVQVMEFAEEFYQHGSESFNGGRVEIDGQLYTHSDPNGLRGGFVTTAKQLQDAWVALETNSDMMFERINTLDGLGSHMQKLAIKLAEKIRQGTDANAHFKNIGSLVKATEEMLTSWDQHIDHLQ